MFYLVTDMQSFTHIEGGVTAAAGFKAAGVEATVKYTSRRDMALLVADEPCVVAALYTSNKVAAAPVLIDRERSASGVAQAVVINSGNANACTGALGLQNAHEMGRLTAAALGIDQSLVLVCSTGVIGVHLPMDKIAMGVKKAAVALSRDGGHNAACAIMTTDSVKKEVAVELEIDGRRIAIGGMAKGSGMIEPNMATMLAFITTDAVIAADALDMALRLAVEISFNRIVVDGDQSTNDTVIAMASAQAGNQSLSQEHPEWERFVDALKTLCLELAKKIVMDGEGATKFVTVKVSGAATAADAQLVARAVAKSPLVKTSWFGVDPNWGRVIAAVGYSGAAVEEQRVQISIGGIVAYDQGRVAQTGELDAMRRAMKARFFEVEINLNLGDGCDTVFTCDLSHDYVSINAEYTT
ncbi:MAG: bifunctional glutamate N-acetyltransferase/amino-acid acetyltransferase ArgJ [Kiritimatiellae bacterium]|nr:bifunctional glutamate N-acetyltransferase/amino-acid acetyltransferase ArgJ [Kiritimatiellia bacterium]